VTLSREAHFDRLDELGKSQMTPTSVEADGLVPSKDRIQHMAWRDAVENGMVNG
jgi:hypothetical protein